MIGFQIRTQLPHIYREVEPDLNYAPSRVHGSTPASKAWASRNRERGVCNESNRSETKDEKQKVGATVHFSIYIYILLY